MMSPEEIAALGELGLAVIGKVLDLVAAVKSGAMAKVDAEAILGGVHATLQSDRAAAEAILAKRFPTP